VTVVVTFSEKIRNGDKMKKREIALLQLKEVLLEFSLQLNKKSATQFKNSINRLYCSTQMTL